MAIDLKFNKLPWYGQLGAFVVLAAAGVGVFWSYYASPRQADIEARQAQLVQMRAQIDQGLKTAAGLPAFRREVAASEAELDQLRLKLPEEKDVGDLLRRIQGMATQSSLVIRGFTPKAVSQKQMYAEWPIGLQLEGTYHNLGNFLERVSRFPRIINVTSIKIIAKETQTGGDTIAADCTAITFVLTEPKKPAAAPGAAGAAPPRAE